MAFVTHHWCRLHLAPAAGYPQQVATDWQIFLGQIYVHFQHHVQHDDEYFVFPPVSAAVDH